MRLLSMLLGTLGASLLGNLLSGEGTLRVVDRLVRAGYGSSIKKALTPPKFNQNLNSMVFILGIICLKQ